MPEMGGRIDSTIEAICESARAREKRGEGRGARGRE